MSIGKPSAPDEGVRRASGKRRSEAGASFFSMRSVTERIPSAIPGNGSMRIATETRIERRSVARVHTNKRPRDTTLQLQAEWRDCRHSANELRQADTLKRLCLRICDDLQLTVLGHAFFQFEPSGVSGTILLSNSRIALYTWPESKVLKAKIRLPNGDRGTDGDALLLLANLKPHFQPAQSSIG
jgi:S-adenosylmethionine/arginine decarboxylase-like enzyme